MTHGYTPQLPDVFPQDKILVEDESHTYETYEGDNNSVLEKTEYTLNKAPVDSVEQVTGINDGDTIDFTQGTDYSLQDLVRNQSNSFTFSDEVDRYELDNAPDSGSTTITDASGDSYTEGVDYDIINPDGIDTDTVEWLDGGSSPDDDEDFTVQFTVTFVNSIIQWDTNERTPDAGSIFYVTYRCDSVISRYIAGSEEQFKSIEDELNAIIEGKFINSASGQQLDEIGKLFGVLGKRNGRSDDSYKTYLKSVVQSFISRGTVNGIRLAVSSALGLEIEDVEINEFFDTNEYEVSVVPNNAFSVSLIEEIADIADPSGINLLRTKIAAADEEMEVQDGLSISEGNLIADSATIDDATTNKENDVLAQDSMAADDAAVVSEVNVAWDSANWDTGHWAVEHN